MKYTIIVIISGVIMIFACTSQMGTSENPFYMDYNTPFATPPFDRIKIDHYLPAFKEGIKQHEAEILQISANAEKPSFDNTVAALENSGVLLRKVSSIFDNMTSANTNDALQSIAKVVSPLRTNHLDNIRLNGQLFTRIKQIYYAKDNLTLTPEEETLLEKYYKEFVRGGANLAEEYKAEFRGINKELSMLSLEFGENILRENNRFELILDNTEDLSGLPAAVIASAEEAAKERGHDGKWVFTLHKPSLIPFLQYSNHRDYREMLFKGYIEQGNNNDSLDNKQILSKMAALRVRRANLLGYPTHAHYILEENMAKTPEAVYGLLNQLWLPALARAKKEAHDLQAMINAEGGNFKLQPWDWWYYSEKLKKAKYDLDEDELRPYFQMENVRKGVFDLATKLFGITFTERKDIQIYHKDVTVFELKEADGTHIGILYTDYYPRASKRGGAWMNEYRIQSNIGGKKVTPIITNVGNFSKPTADEPSLLSLDEVLTLFHEFGHALHGLLSDCTYPKLAGTNVARDFVELQSQIMENWALDPQMLQSYAKHYKTGEPIPAELIEKIKKSNKFNQGFATTEYLAAALLDMDWHTLSVAEEKDVLDFENKTLQKIGLIPEIVVRYRSPYFRHIFSGGYSSGYYSYIWAEVLDADAFQAFRESGIFNRETAAKYRKYILARGGTEDAMALYKKFRGAEPTIDPLLERRGLN